MKTAASILFSLMIVMLFGITGLANAEPESSGATMPMHGAQSAGPYREGGAMADGDEARRADAHSALSPIKAEYAKKQAPVKARYKALKLELMALSLSDSPDGAAIDKKIDEMLELKRQLLRNKADKVIAIRKALDEGQRPEYDLRVMKKAARDRAYQGSRGGYHGFERGFEHGDMRWHGHGGMER